MRPSRPPLFCGGALACTGLCSFSVVCRATSDTRKIHAISKLLLSQWFVSSDSLKKLCLSHFLDHPRQPKKSSISVSEVPDLATSWRVTQPLAVAFSLSLFLHFGIPQSFNICSKFCFFSSSCICSPEILASISLTSSKICFRRSFRASLINFFFRSIMAKSFPCHTLIFLTTQSQCKLQMAARLALRMEEVVGFSSFQSIHHTSFLENKSRVCAGEFLQA